MHARSFALRTLALVGAAFVGQGVASARTPLPDSAVRYDGHQVIRLEVQSWQQLERLQNMSLDIWSCTPRPGPLDVRVTLEQKAAVTQAGFEFRVVIDDVQALIDRQRAFVPRVSAFFDNYRTNGEITTFLNGLVTADPSLAEMVDMGTSVEGRTLWGIRITGPGDPGTRPAVLYHGIEHAREWVSSTVPAFVAEHLLTNYGIDPEVTDLVDSVEWFLLPVMNPDGYEYTQTTDRLWRKNRRDNGNGSFGVDLNRNWGFEWGGEGASASSFDPNYRGTAPFSEPETQALRDFILAHTNLRAHLDFHSFSQLILAPWSYTAEFPVHQPTFQFLGAGMQQAIAAVHGKTYGHGPAYTTIGPAAGASGDWVHGDRGIWSFGVELRDTGEFGFLLPADQIIPTCEENLQAILFLTDWVTNPLWYLLPEDLPEFASPIVATPTTVRISPLAEQVVPGSETLHFRTSSADTFVPIAMTPLGGDLFGADIPTAPCGSSPEFYFSALGNLGTTVTEPPTAPAEVLPLQVADIRFADDFEADQGWMVSGDASEGQWERGTPGLGARGDPAADSDGSGQCYLTDNRDGNSDVDNGTTILTSPVLDMSDGARITFAYWLNDVSFSPMGPEDSMTVEVATNGAGDNWQLLRTYDSPAAEWRTESIAVGTEITATDTIRIRFSVSDLAPGSVVEAGLDALVVFGLTCDTPAVPGDCDGSGQVNLVDFATFANCFGLSGPNAGCVAADFACSDLDGNGSVNLVDFSTFALNFTG